MYSLICGSFKPAKNNWVRILQIRKLPHLRKVRKSRQKLKLANMRIFDLRHLFADTLPLEKYFAHIYHALEIFAVVCSRTVTSRGRTE
jgi:hypothetical protein